MDAERARKRLAEERARVEEELAGLGANTAPDDPQDFGDQARELDQDEVDEALREQLRDTLDAIERAERRLDEGTYGLSVVSGEPIPDGRLEAIPWAERTVEEEQRAP
jgi:DnaK suppressor protein